jgi:hypothetical protein
MTRSQVTSRFKKKVVKKEHLTGTHKEIKWGGNSVSSRKRNQIVLTLECGHSIKQTFDKNRKYEYVICQECKYEAGYE